MMTKAKAAGNATLESLRDDSAKLASLFGTLFWIGLFLIFAQAIYVPLKGLLATIGTDQAGPAAKLLLTELIDRLPAIALCFALLSARHVFRAFADDGVLTARGSKALARLGNDLMLAALLALAVGSDTSATGSGTIALVSGVIVLGCVGLAIRMLGRIFVIAAEIKADSDQIV